MVAPQSRWFDTNMQASLGIPAFTKGKDQLSPDEVEETRAIAMVRNMLSALLEWPDKVVYPIRNSIN